MLPKRRRSQPAKRPAPKRERLRILKLEKRIAPRCHTNPHGKLVGCGRGGLTK